MPHRRKDRPLQATDSVCEKHFEPHLVTKTWTAQYNGNVPMSVPRRASLACDAVPTIFPDCPPYLSKRSTWNLRKRSQDQRKLVVRRSKACVAKYHSHSAF
ncbi:hypothetical protein HPB48_018101 [Haemaphysalis longicornis]|uniref:THAP-type domain-containing protein n=1 Tax=Haemaphysalis longicornis TaxID=44386 RepID=A0A9J6GVK1_HAELO|nr:hypothetical protein HPB48_018101 [Haemaphysalis longicornis]